MRTVTQAGSTTNVVRSHYDGSGGAVAWTSEEGGEAKQTVDISGIDGTLAAVQTAGSEAILQLHDLKGDVVATAADNQWAGKLLSTQSSSEFGVPLGGEGATEAYSWLGASGLRSELSSGAIVEGGTAYVPQTGRMLQSEAVEPPGLPYGSGGGAAYVSEDQPWVMQADGERAAEAPGREAGWELEAAEAAAAAGDGVFVGAIEGEGSSVEGSSDMARISSATHVGTTEGGCEPSPDHACRLSAHAEKCMWKPLGECVGWAEDLSFSWWTNMDQTWGTVGSMTADSEGNLEGSGVFCAGADIGFAVTQDNCQWAGSNPAFASEGEYLDAVDVFGTTAVIHGGPIGSTHKIIVAIDRRWWRVVAS